MPVQPANFLSAPMATQRFIEAARDDTGFLKGEIGGPLPGWHTPGQDNAATLEALHRGLRQKFPAAGKPLWAVRLWTNLLWQPAYLAVIAVHRCAALPDLRGLTQRVTGAYIESYRLQPSQPETAPLPDLIDLAGTRLRAMAEAMLVEVNTYEKLRPLPARRLLADRVLSLMVRLARQRPELPAAVIQVYCQRWLAALGLTGQGELETWPLPDGRAVVINARKGCCLDYLVAPGTLCASCPKQGVDLRRARQLADWG